MQSSHSYYWVNDYDPGIAALWQAAAQYPAELKAAIMNVRPSLEEFDRLKVFFLSLPTMPSAAAEIVRMGCGKLVLHRLSWSGVGAMGGPLGGRHQSGTQKIDGRWNPAVICEKIDKISVRTTAVKITSVDYSELILDEGRSAILYLDPPYYDQGANLYQHAFTGADHLRLRNLLQVTNHKWLLSYDDCPEVRDLYSFADVREIKLPYSMQRVGMKRELLICNANIPPHMAQSTGPIFDFGGRPDARRRPI